MNHLLIAVLVAVFSAMMVLGNDDPTARDALCKHVRFCPWSAHAGAINRILYDIGIGGVVSLVFYLLLVTLPEYRKRRRIKRSLEKHYRMFKRDCIQSMLAVVDGTYDFDTVDALVEQARFRDYFNQPISDSQDRWHALMNNLDEYHLHEILIALEVFRDEVLFALNNTDIADDKAFEFFKRLSGIIYSIKDTQLGYDETKPFFNFLYDVFAGFSIVTGYRQEDIVERTIRAI
ncbi:MAG: hypothetical protein ACRED5_22810 [Propylenella sp.]